MVLFLPPDCNAGVFSYGKADSTHTHMMWLDKNFVSGFSQSCTVSKPMQEWNDFF